MEIIINDKKIDISNFKLKVKYLLELERKGYNYFQMLSNISENNFAFEPIVEILAIFLKDYGVKRDELLDCDFNQLQDIMIAFFGSGEEVTEKTSGE